MSFTTNGSGTITGYSNITVTSLTIPASIGGVTITSVEGFNDYEFLTSVTFEPNPLLVTIGSAAFIRTPITTISIPDSVTNIGGYAFNGCTSLTSINLPTSLTSIQNNMFQGCTSLTALTIPSGVATIGGSVIQSTHITSLTIPASVYYIGYYGLVYAPYLTSVTFLGDFNASMNSNSFEGCPLTSITVPTFTGNWGTKTQYFTGFNVMVSSDGSAPPPPSFTTNGSGTITAYSDSTTASLTIPASIEGENITAIGGSAFDGYTSLTSVTFAANPLLVSICSAAFRGKPITTISIPDSVTSIGGEAFKSCSALTSIHLPTSLTSIQGNMFQSCSSLTALTIPSGVTAISGASVIQSSGITSLTIPASVTTIAWYALAYDSYLTSVIFLGDFNVNMNVDSFEGDSAITSMTVPTLLSGSWVGKENYFPGFNITSEELGEGEGGGGGGGGGGEPPIVEVPCFPTGTKVLTAAGYKAVETLASSDKIVTADGRTVAFNLYSTHVKSATKETAPYVIPANTFGSKSPASDLTLSPLHAIQSRKGIWQIPKYAALTHSAIHQVCLGEQVTYYHVELPNFFTDNIVAEGTIVESYGLKQTKGMKNVYKFNTSLNGFTRISNATSTVRK